MANDSTRVTVAAKFRVLIAPVGTAAPADDSAAISATWKEVGYTTRDGTTFQASDPSWEDIPAHQADRPVRTVQTGEGGSVSVDLEEFSQRNLVAVMGGGTITTVSAGHYKYVPPVIGGRTSVAMILEVIDGTKVYRYVVPRALQREGVSIPFNPTGPKVLPLRASVQGSDVGDPWYLLTNDPAFDPAA